MAQRVKPKDPTTRLLSFSFTFSQTLTKNKTKSLNSLGISQLLVNDSHSMSELPMIPLVG